MFILAMISWGGGCVTISTPQDGAVVLRVQVDSINWFDRGNVKKIHKQDLDSLIPMSWFPNEPNDANSKCM